MRNNSNPDGRRSVAIIGTRGYPSYYGGFETAVRKLAPYLADNDWDVTVYGRPGQTRPDDIELDPRIHSISTAGIDSNSLSTLSYGFTSCLHAFFRKPDVALVMNVANGYWLPILKLRGIPTVVNVDGIEWHRAKWGRLAKAMFRWGARLTAKFADHLVFDARAIETYWMSEFNRTGTFVPYGGDPQRAAELPLEPGLDSGKYVLLVARFVPENTVSEFVAAAREISKHFDVVLVGSAADENPIQQEVASLAATNSRVHWLGHISDDTRLYGLWHHAGAYFHGHSVGGTNPALVQAMHLGAPIVARDTVYNREVLATAGVFCEASPTDIALKVVEVLEAPGDLSARATSRAAEYYSWQSVRESYERTIDAVRARTDPPVVPNVDEITRTNL